MAGTTAADCGAVDDVVAVEVELENGLLRYFVTWGRIQDRVDPQPLEALVLRHSRQFSLPAPAKSARVCGSLREAADSEAAPYFYECLLSLGRQPIPFGDGYEVWRADRAAAMEEGRGIAFCG